jgi:hypothetical protein
MFNLLLKLLKKHLNSEENRIKVYSLLKESVEETYYEQTKFGNVYNAFTEFVMADEFIRTCTKEDFENSLSTIKQGIGNAFYESLEYIKQDIKKTENKQGKRNRNQR